MEITSPPDFQDGFCTTAEEMRERLIDAHSKMLSKRKVHNLTLVGQIHARQLAAEK